MDILDRYGIIPGMGILFRRTKKSFKNGNQIESPLNSKKRGTL